MIREILQNCNTNDGTMIQLFLIKPTCPAFLFLKTANSFVILQLHNQYFMLQRIQSVYLLVVILFQILVFFIPVFYWEVSGGDTTSFALNGMYDLPLIILNGVIILLAVFTIFQYKQRKKQAGYCYILLGTVFALIGFFMFYMIKISATQGYVLNALKGAGIYLLLINMVLCLLAARRIKKDEELVKSIDRIR